MTGTKVTSSQARRAAAAAEKAERARVERQRRSRRRAVRLLAGMLLIAAIGVAVQAQRGSPQGGSSTPAGLDAGTGFAIGAASAPVTVEVYEDFLCPACKHFEDLSGPTLASLVKDNQVRVVYRVIAILDRASTTDYSTRAMNAAACVGTSGFAAFHQALYAAQPAEGSAGLSDSRLTELARDAGADGQVAGCISGREYGHWVASATDEASRRGVNSTPTVLVNGSPLRSWAPADLLAAVEAARR